MFPADIQVTCDPVCRSMDVKIDFTQRIPQKFRINTPNFKPQQKNDNCYFEAEDSERAFFGISMYGCSTTELTNVRPSYIPRISMISHSATLQQEGGSLQ